MAHWIIEDKGFGGCFFKCSNCNESWCDIFDQDMSTWKKCPKCGEELNEDEIEYVEEKKTLSNIADAIRKIQQPAISINWTHTERNLFRNAMKREDTIHKLELLSGMSLDELVGKFAAGWELKPPSYVMGFDTEGLMESMRKEAEGEIRMAGYLNAGKFDVELLKHQLETMDEMKCYGVDLEEIGSGAPDKIRPVWNLKIDFDGRPEKEPSNKKYKIEIWVYGRLDESYESGDIEEVLKWYRIRWKHIYDCGGCCFDIYENDRILEFEEESTLGFYK